MQEEERERSVVIENSLQDDQMIERSYRLLQAPDQLIKEKGVLRDARTKVL